jgi:superfamily II DNA/RNA helicase
MGFDDTNFVLPELIERETIVDCSRPLPGRLFVEPAVGLKEQREERRATLKERCEMVAEKVNSNSVALVWCNLNDEGDLLEQLIPDAVQVAGKHTDDEKEERLLAFAENKIRVLITKAKISGFGLNFQNCHHTTFFPSHSYEQYYQGVRRMWRFGQTNPVVVDIITTKGEIDVLKNLQRKATQADQMFSKLVGYMNHALSVDSSRIYDKQERIPQWL